MQTLMVNGEQREAGQKPAGMPAVRVNGTEIPEAEILQEAQNHPAASPQEALAEAARALVVRELLIQQARTLELNPEPEAGEDGAMETPEDALIRQVLDREVVVPQASDENCRRYYDNNKNRFRSGDLFIVQHILLAARPKEEAAREEAKQEAEGLITILREKPGLFEKLAESHSACSTASEGGNLGQISHGQTVPEFEKVLNRLGDGDLSARPVETRFGFHVVRLNQKIPGRQLAFEDVRELVARYLEDATWHRASAQYVGILAGQAKIEGIRLDASESPLVQ
jgi:peptidyl-prolyl cis-trans isomerase C